MTWNRGIVCGVAALMIACATAATATAQTQDKDCNKSTNGGTTTTNPFALTQAQRTALRTAMPALDKSWFAFWKTARTTFTQTEFQTLLTQLGSELATLRTAADWASFFAIWDSAYATINTAVTTKADATLSTAYATLFSNYQAVRTIILGP